MLHSIYQQIWKTQQWQQDWKKSVFITILKKGKAKDGSCYRTIELNSHASKVNSNFSKPGFKSMWTVNFQIVKLDLEKAEEPEIKLPTSVGSSKRQKSSRETSTSTLLTMPKLLTVCFTTNIENSSRDGNTRPPNLPPEKSVAGQEATVRTGHGLTDWFQIWKGYIKAVYCHPAYLTYMQSSVQFSSSVMSNYLRPNEPQHTRTPVHHQLLNSTQTHVHWIGEAM